MHNFKYKFLVKFKGEFLIGLQKFTKLTKNGFLMCVRSFFVPKNSVEGALIKLFTVEVNDFLQKFLFDISVSEF